MYWQSRRSAVTLDMLYQILAYVAIEAKSAIEYYSIALFKNLRSSEEARMDAVWVRLLSFDNRCNPSIVS
jgi:hypothetical protein